VLPLIGNFLLFLAALAAGVVVMAFIVVLLKSRDRNLDAIDASATV
jgi:PTS system fructose-specific IIC component